MSSKCGSETDLVNELHKLLDENEALAYKLRVVMRERDKDRQYIMELEEERTHWRGQVLDQWCDEMLEEDAEEEASWWARHWESGADLHYPLEVVETPLTKKLKQDYALEQAVFRKPFEGI